MSFWSSTWRGVAVAAAALAVLASTLQPISAQQAPKLTITGFLADPGQILRLYPNGGPQMTAQIRDLGVDPAALLPILGLLANANKFQKFAIGSGLGQSAKIVLRTNQPYYTDLQEAIAKTKDQDVVQAFGLSIGDRELGTVGGGAGGGGGGGGQTNSLAASTGGNSGAVANTTGTSTGSSGVTTGGGAGGGGGSGGGTNLTTSTSP